MTAVTITRNADGTITVRRGRYIETITPGPSRVDLVDALRWAAITAGASVTEEQIWQALQEEATDG